MKRHSFMTRTTNIIGIRGEKTPVVRAGPGRENTSVLATVCADGTCLDPFIIYTGKRLQTQWIGRSEQCPNVQYAVSEKGWMTSKLFENFFEETFVPHVNSKGSGPALLVFDGHVSHISLQLVSQAARTALPW